MSSLLTALHKDSVTILALIFINQGLIVLVIASAFTVPHFYISPRCRTRCSEQNYSNLNNRCWQQQHLPVSEGKNAANSTFWWWAERPTANMKTKAECYMKDVLDEKNIYSNVMFCIFSNTNIWKNALVA